VSKKDTTSGKVLFFSFLNKQLKDLGKTSHYKNIKLSQVW
jgi:hypothetical protein